MLDCQLFGLNAGGHHFTNVLLHTIAAVLLFLLLQRMTGASWPGAFARRALQLAIAQDNFALASKLEKDLDLYRSSIPLRRSGPPNVHQ
jgi:hypothetical protein